MLATDSADASGQYINWFHKFVAFASGGKQPPYQEGVTASLRLSNCPLCNELRRLPFFACRHTTVYARCLFTTVLVDACCLLATRALRTDKFVRMPTIKCLTLLRKTNAKNQSFPWHFPPGVKTGRAFSRKEGTERAIRCRRSKALVKIGRSAVRRRTTSPVSSANRGQIAIRGLLRECSIST